MPSTISDNNTELIYLDSEESTLDLKGKVPKPGPYVFAVHYYQPDFPGILVFSCNTVMKNPVNNYILIG